MHAIASRPEIFVTYHDAHAFPEYLLTVRRE